MTIKTDAVVVYDYVLTDRQGAELEQSDPHRPSSYIHGRGMIIPGLERALEAKPLGAYEFFVPAREAYGERDEALVLSTPLADVPEDVEPKVGERVMVSIDGGADREARIVAVSDREVTADANHRLAGIDLRVRVTVRQIRDATVDELEHGVVRSFPFDVFGERAAFGGEQGDRLRSVEGLAMFPPYPWGTNLYGDLLRGRCADLDGDVIELGVGLGGMSLFLGRIAKDLQKKVYSLDSFAGLPRPDGAKDNDYFRATDYAGTTDVLERFRQNIRRFELDGTVTPIQGFFAETLPRLPADLRLCLAHLDSDLFDSVITSLEAIYDRVVDGGVIVIDDFFHHAQGPARACASFFSQRGIRPVYYVTFPYSVAIIKGEESRDRKRSLDGNVYSLDWLRTDALLRASVRRSLQTGCRDTAWTANCERLLTLLEGSGHRSSDIYLYLHALQDFWDHIDVDSAREPIRI
jgi:FKBP-type peptidyl-prolyl cis-trans isomerase 2